MTMSSQTINIRRDVKDSFYRYKMPKLLSKIEGKGNGIKTVIPNMSDIAKALHRPATYPTKYFGNELGAQVKIDEVNDRYIVNGAHDAPKLQAVLDGFIQKFVLCASCFNPETDLVITKDNDIIRDCKACGKNTPVDMRHKLVAFILKNPPTISHYGGSSNSVASKSGKSKKKSKSKDDLNEDGDGDGESEQEEDGDDALTRQIQREAAELPDKVQSKLDDWSADLTEEAIAKRQQELGGLDDEMTKRLNLSGDEDEEDPFEEFADFLKEKPNASPAEIAAEVSQLGLREDKAVAVLVQVIFTEDVLKQIPQKKAIFAKLIKNEKAQKAFLGGMERLVGVAYPTLLSKIPMILKIAYDEDILDEDAILAWGKKPSKKYVPKDVSKEIRKKAQPFLDWLENADEESEDDESD